MKTMCLVLLAVTLALVASSIAAGDVTACRQIANKCSDAVVRVQVVVKSSMSFGGESSPKRESKSDVTGAVVDPSGLTVVSLSMMDPAGAYGSMFSDRGAETTSEVTDIKIRQTDGTEVSGKVVLRDKDLDLAFIRPAEKQSAPWPYIDLKACGSGEMLDQVLLVTRLGKTVNRAMSASIQSIQAVVEKPRKLYVVSMPMVGAEMASPVFAMDGKLLGMVFLRTSPGKMSSDSMVTSDMMLPVVIPAEDIAQVASQAPEEALKVPAAPAGTPGKIATVKPAAPAKPAPKKK